MSDCRSQQCEKLDCVTTHQWLRMSNPYTYPTYINIYWYIGILGWIPLQSTRRIHRKITDTYIDFDWELPLQDPSQVCVQRWRGVMLWKSCSRFFATLQIDRKQVTCNMYEDNKTSPFYWHKTSKGLNWQSPKEIQGVCCDNKRVKDPSHSHSVVWIYKKSPSWFTNI